MQHPKRIRIYHDRSCPICRAEMEELKAIDSQDQLELIDCSVEAFDDAEARDAGLTQQALMSALYIQDSDQRWLQGPDAFEAIYNTLGMHSIANLWGSKRLRPLVNIGYRLFARTRGLLALLGFERIVRWYVRREAQRAAARATQCNTDDV